LNREYLHLKCIVTLMLNWYCKATSNLEQFFFPKTT
jgi:hypothetical protein